MNLQLDLVNTCSNIWRLVIKGVTLGDEWSNAWR